MIKLTLEDIDRFVAIVFTMSVIVIVLISEVTWMDVIGFLITLFIVGCDILVFNAVYETFKRDE